MAYQVSARKWRPQTFDEVIGQKHVAKTLVNAVRQGKVAQAYLFSGVRGVGKTTMARILAKALNCAAALDGSPCNRCVSCQEITEGRSVDVVEIDGASNTGVDDIRELRENVKYLPLRGKFKVYIIDEVHMLSNAAFNALLKTVEEPPPHLVFILATTEPHKIPATILSRCQHFTFRRISRQEIMAQLHRVAEERKVRFPGGGLGLIAKAAEGSMRDALSFLDQAISYGGDEVTEEDLFTLLGRMGAAQLHLLVQAIHQKNAPALLGLAKEIADKGYNLRQFIIDWMEHLRHLIIAQNVISPQALSEARTGAREVEAWIDLPSEEIEEVLTEAAFFTPEELHRLFSLFARLQEEIRNASHPHLLFEVALMKALLFTRFQPIEKLLERLDSLQGDRPGTDPQRDRLPAPAPSAAPEHQTHRLPPRGESPRPSSDSSPSKAGAFVTPAPEAKKNPSSAPDKKEVWGKIVAQIREKRTMLGSFLESGTLLEIEEQRVKIGFLNPFSLRMVQEDENKTLIAAAFRSYFQKEMECLLVDVGESPSGSSPSSRKEKGDTGSSHPLIREVLRTLGGEVIETKQRAG